MFVKHKSSSLRATKKWRTRLNDVSMQCKITLGLNFMFKSECFFSFFSSLIRLSEETEFRRGYIARYESSAFGTSRLCVFLCGLYAAHFIFPGRKHSCISVLHGSKAEGSEVGRQIGDKWCPLLVSVLHFKADVLPSLIKFENSASLFFSNGENRGILVLYRSRCVAKAQNIWWPNIRSHGRCLSVLQALPSG